MEHKYIDLARENRRLLVLFFTAVVLIGPSFTLGYVSGHGSAAVLPGPSGPVPVAPLPSPLPGEAAVQPSSQTDNPKPPERTLPSAPLAEADQPLPGQIYLQVVAVPQGQSASMIQALRKNGFPAIATRIPERPELYRVLVGPLRESGLDQTRTGLQSKGFPADAAIKRIF